MKPNYREIALLAIVVIMASCSRKTTEAITTTETIDSSAVMELRTRNEILKDSVYTLSQKLTTVTKQLATVLTGETGVNDTASRLPMQTRTLNVGNSQITVKGRWEYLNYTVKIGETVSTDTGENRTHTIRFADGLFTTNNRINLCER